MNVLNSFFDFLYIAVIIMGGVTWTLALILNAKERDKNHRAILMFIGAIFVYMIVDFITYYFLSQLSSGKAVFALITVSDILFSVMVTAWVYAIIVFIRIEDVIKIRWVIGISVIYQLSAQILSITLGRYDSYILYVDNGPGKMVLQALNVMYTVFIIAIGIICVIMLLKRYQKGMRRGLGLVFSMLLVGYMCYIAYWDYSVWLINEEKMWEIYAIDPLIMLYAIFNSAVIYYFYSKDPLRLQDSQVAPEDAVRIVSQRYELSGRESQVLHLINCGMSNPQIAEELSISENTVKRHVNNIFRKTEVQSRHELVFKISNTK